MTNELECPVCGKEAYENEEGFMKCTNNNCSYIDDMSVDDFSELSESIQSRIDKAVIAERERAAIAMATCYANGIFDIDIIISKIKEG